MAENEPALTLQNIEYLAFEGGGGKGAAYLGALVALEELGLLPIKRDAPGQIKGISGGSVGSITAFLLALGYDSASVWESITSEQFKAFLDGPDLGDCRLAGFTDDDVVASGRKTRPPDSGLEKKIADVFRRYPIRHPVGSLLKAVMVLILLLGKDRDETVAAHVAEIVAPLFMRKAARGAKRSEKMTDDYLVGALQRDPSGYLQNLLYDPGLFPAFAVRDFLSKKLAEKIDQWTSELEQAVQSTNNPHDAALLDKLYKIDAETMTFAEFQAVTNIDLIVAGTQLLADISPEVAAKLPALSRSVPGADLAAPRPAYFSSETTPAFPVIEAVGLSMSIPIFFKSVYIDASDDRYARFKGWWMDGGAVNNLPLHAFNVDAQGKRPYHPHERMACRFNESTLGFVLDEPDLTEFGTPPSRPPEFPGVVQLLTPLMDALMFSASEGQMRTAVERAHVIRINAYYLGTYDLVPHPLIVAAGVPEARRKVHRAFNKAPPADARARPAYRTIVQALNGKAESGTANMAILKKMTSQKFAVKVVEDILTG